LTHGDLVSQALSYSDIGRSRAELGDFNQARPYLKKALDLAEKIGDPCLAGWVLTDQAYLALLAGEQSEWHGGSEAAKRAVALFKTESNVGPLVNALDKSASLHLALGELDEALESSTEVMHLLETAPVFPKPQEHLYTHAQVLRAVGREAEADEHLRRAYERVMFVADKLADEVLRQSWLENVRANRDILREWEERRRGRSHLS
jgi:tetratricopeptide (TPR) repeat protein